MIQANPIRKHHLTLLLAASAAILSSCSSSIPQSTVEKQTYTAQTCWRTVDGTSALPGDYNPIQSESTHKKLVTTNYVTRPSVSGPLKVDLQIFQDTGTCNVGLVGVMNGYYKPVQLRGMSTHGLQWFPEIIQNKDGTPNDNAFKALKNDWGSNVIRLAMYVGENGYATNPTKIKDIVIAGIRQAIANDMYVIVDWHVHNPGDPNAPVYQGAMEFFREISTLFPNNKHILYEIANEPNGGPGNDPGIPDNTEGWLKIKSYAEPIIKMLRDRGNKNVVIVGTPRWSRMLHLAADNPVRDPINNTMYTAHMYTGSHFVSQELLDYSNYGNNITEAQKDNIMSSIRYALSKSQAVFVTEWGTSLDVGTGGPFLNQADAWVNWLNSRGISWVNWNLSNKGETSSAFLANLSEVLPNRVCVPQKTLLDPGTDQKWYSNELSKSGEYIRARIKGQAYRPIDRWYHKVVWDFNDGTTQGFGKPPYYTNQPVEVTNDKNRLKISSLKTFNLPWNEEKTARIWSKTSAIKPNIKGAKSLTLDVIVQRPNAVELKLEAFGDPSISGWTNSGRPYPIPAAMFIEQPDRTYKATVTFSGETKLPNLLTIGQHPTNNILDTLYLYVATEDTTDNDTVWIDNITINGVGNEPYSSHGPAGTATLPSTFEDGTRQGWQWDGESFYDDRMTVETVNGSKALSFYLDPCALPGEKVDTWDGSPRFTMPIKEVTFNGNTRARFDLYLKPDQWTTGSLNVNLAFHPGELAGWAHASSTNANLAHTDLTAAKLTPDGYYKLSVDFTLPSGIRPEMKLNRATVIIQDYKTDFRGRIAVDNVSLVP